MRNEIKEHCIIRWDPSLSYTIVFFSFSIFLGVLISMCLSSSASRSDNQYPDTLSPTWFLDCLSRYKREICIYVYTYTIFVERASARLTRSLSLPYPFLHLSFRLSRLHSHFSYSLPHSLLAYHLNNANDWMVQVSKSCRDNLYCNYNEALYAVGIHGGQRSSSDWGLHSALVRRLLPFLQLLTFVFIYAILPVPFRFHEIIPVPFFYGRMSRSRQSWEKRRKRQRNTEQRDIITLN